MFPKERFFKLTRSVHEHGCLKNMEKRVQPIVVNGSSELLETFQEASFCFLCLPKNYVNLLSLCL